MAGAVDLLLIVAAEHRLAELGPAGGVQKVRVLVRPQHSHAVQLPGGIGREGQKQLSVMAQQGGPLVYPELPPLPVVIRGSQQHLDRSQSDGGLHPGDIQVGDLLAYPHLLRPDHIPLPSVGKHRGVQGKGPEGEGVVLRRLHGAQLLPGIPHGVPGAVKHVGADLPHVVLVAAGVVDIPLPVDPVELRSPDMDGLGTGRVFDPEGPLLRLPQAGQGVRIAQDDPIILRHGGGEIVAALLPPQDIWVRPLPDKGAVIDGFMYSCLIHSVTSHRGRAWPGRNECIIPPRRPGCKCHFRFWLNIILLLAIFVDSHGRHPPGPAL